SSDGKYYYDDPLQPIGESSFCSHIYSFDNVKLIGVPILMKRDVESGDWAMTLAVVVSVIVPDITPRLSPNPCNANFASDSVRLSSVGTSTSLAPLPFPSTSVMDEPLEIILPAFIF